jgi:4-azaleucine resistance transporter AzlC
MRIVSTEALAALRASGSVGLGFVPLGIAFGVFLTHSGLTWWWASVFAAVIYAGSFEFLLVGLVTALAPLATIALTAFLVNVRHVFYTLSFPLHRVDGRAAKTYSTFALSDEAYALTTADGARCWPSSRITWLQALIHLYWIASATLGGLVGSLIPDNLAGLDFALTALFAVLALDAIRARRRDLVTPGLALLSALVARVALPGQMLVVAFALFIALLLARHLVTNKGAVDA